MGEALTKLGDCIIESDSANSDDANEEDVGEDIIAENKDIKTQRRKFKNLMVG